MSNQKVEAKVLWQKHSTCEEEVQVGDHVIHSGGGVDGYCYQHNDFDCVLTQEEREALQSPIYPSTGEE